MESIIENKKKSRKLPLVVEALFMLFLPVIGFILFSHFSYPLNPHCSLGNGLLGCTPYCVSIGDSYEVTPCFHDDPTNLQTFSFNHSFLHFLVFFVPIGVLLLVMGAEKLFRQIVRIALYPIFLIKESRKQKTVSRLFSVLLALPIFVEWAVGYVVLIGMVFGFNLFD